ncbi:hypothetical protein DFH09DRAFT_46480 [Mycena vulgaris]|nr:hypothetical protein DFH09DRAFT_46480 [Mycena vulgaris]
MGCEGCGAARQWRRRDAEATRQRAVPGARACGGRPRYRRALQRCSRSAAGRSRSSAERCELSMRCARPPFTAAPSPPPSSFTILVHGVSWPCGVVALRGWGATEERVRSGSRGSSTNTRALDGTSVGELDARRVLQVSAWACGYSGKKARAGRDGVQDSPQRPAHSIRVESGRAR